MRNILVAFDGSTGAELALERVAIFAEKEANIHLLAVGRIPEYAETVSEVDESKEAAAHHYEKALERAAKKLASLGLRVETHIDYGKPSEVIVRKAEELVTDLIVVGTNQHSAFMRRVVGATADKIVDSAHCSVLVVRPRILPGGAR